jgi:hypothetical protein
MQAIQYFAAGRLCRSIRITNGPLFVLVLLSSFFFLPGLRSSAQTADSKPVYVSVSYIKVHPEKEMQYRELLKKYGKKINEYFYKNKMILGWYMHQVVMPTGSAAEYDFAAVNVSASLKDLLDDSVSIKTVFKKVFPGTTDKMFDSIAAQYQHVRSIVKREVFRSVTGLNMDPAAPPTKYASLDFMKTLPGKAPEYEKMEKETWMPLHKERVSQGAIKDWQLFEKIMPYGAKEESDYVTVQFFDNLATLENPRYMEAFNKVWAGQDVTKFMQNTESTRTLVKNELWEVIDYVDATNTK